MKLTENEFRDLLFFQHKYSLSEIIEGRRDAVEWDEMSFPPISFLIRKNAEKRINLLIDSLESLVISARELNLNKQGESTTRIDLFGSSERYGLTIIELKKSKQTERQAFTELLAYSNHFCSTFPGLNESFISSILIAPMGSRTVRDAYLQELIINNKNILALIPEEEDDKIVLRVYYPDRSCYDWFENSVLHDYTMSTVAISFPLLEGWIDSDVDSHGKIPDYSRDALNTISSAISHKLEASNIHGLVYASQKWGEIAKIFPYPNTIFIAAINPFSSFVNSSNKSMKFDAHRESRINTIQSILDQLSPDESECWRSNLELSFYGYLIRMVKCEFDSCFKNTGLSKVKTEISCPDWYGIKVSMIDAVCVHNLDISLTGILREIYFEYIHYIYNSGKDDIFYMDDLPKYSYKTLRNFLPVWEILSNLGTRARTRT